MGKKKELYRVERSNETLDIHLVGDILPNTVFQKVIELMRENRECENPKGVRFVVDSSVMMMAVKYAIPSQFYEEVVLEGQYSADKDEVLKDAAGM